MVNFVRDAGTDKTPDRFFPGLTGTKRESKHKLVYAWLKKCKTIEDMCVVSSTASMRSKRSRSSGTVLTRERKESIVSWIVSIQNEGIPVSARMLQLKAKDVATALGISRTVFDGSWLWKKGKPTRPVVSRKYTARSAAS